MRLSPITMVSAASMVQDTSEQRKSMETRGSSATARMPFMGPSAASRNAALISSAVHFFSVWMTMSTTETLGVGTRSAMPLSFPLSWGSTSATALAAPVEVGTMLSAAARARRPWRSSSRRPWRSPWRSRLCVNEERGWLAAVSGEDLVRWRAIPVFDLPGSSDGSRISARAVRVALAFGANGSGFGVVDD